MKVKLEDNIFFGEEVERIGSFEKTEAGEKELTEIFQRDDGGFIIKRSLVDRTDSDSINYDVISKEAAEMIAWKFKAFTKPKRKKRF